MVIVFCSEILGKEISVAILMWHADVGRQSKPQDVNTEDMVGTVKKLVFSKVEA